MTIDDRGRRAGEHLERLSIPAPPPIAAVQRRRALRRLRGGAALAAVALIASAAATRSGGGGDVGVVAERPERGTDVAERVEPDSTTTTTLLAVPPAARMPARFVAVRENGDLVFVEEGVPRVLTSHGDPREETELGAHGIDGVALHAARETVFYSVCCEPAAGHIALVTLAGGRNPDVDYGYYPAVSPDGRYLAFGVYNGVAVVDLEAATKHTIEASEPPGLTRRVAWYGSELLAVEQGDPPDEREVVVVARDAKSLDDAARITPPGRTWSHPAFRSDGNLLVVEQCCGFEPRGPARGVVVDPRTGAEVSSFDYEGAVLAQAFDDTGTWLLYVTADKATAVAQRRRRRRSR